MPGGDVHAVHPGLLLPEGCTSFTGFKKNDNVKGLFRFCA